MFLIDTDLLHDYFGLNAYKNNKRREGGRDKDVEWKRSFSIFQCIGNRALGPYLVLIAFAVLQNFAS